MASPFDDLDRRKLDETHARVELLVKQLAIVQDLVQKLINVKQWGASSFGRKYLRRLLQQKREENAELKLYVVQLENELRLRGLE